MRPTIAIALVLGLAGCPSAGTSTETTAERAMPSAEPGTTDSPLPGRVPTDAEARAFRPLTEAAERVRGLRFLRAVPTRVQSQAEIRGFVSGAVDREELEQSRIFYGALGLLPPGLDVEEMLLAVMGEQIIGYYDPKRTVMVVRDDVAAQLASRGTEEGDESAIVLVHEYVHALQDQHLGLRAAHELDRSIDAENAFASLVEGDATLAMVGWLLESRGIRLSQLTRNPGALGAMLQSGGGMGGNNAQLASAPAIVRAPLMSRYLDGLVYCATLHGHGGFRWIDDAHRGPPDTTEQILHPELYVRRERPDAVALPPFPALEAAGYAVHDEDTLGELETSVYFAQGTSQDRERAAAAGWGGDRLRVYRRDDGSTAVTWFTTWDGDADAIEAEAAAQRVASAVEPAENARSAVRRSGRAVLIVRGLDPALQTVVQGEFDRFVEALPARRSNP